jgi:Protein of unknown function (DUF2971)
MPPRRASEVKKQVTAFETYLRKLGKLHAGPRPPKHLYHYTTGNGLIGIVKSSALWATDARYMNDSSEVKYAQELVTERFKKFASTRAGAHMALLQIDLGFLWPMREDIYLTCFCEKPDELNQWRVYAGDDGYSIGFAASRLKAYGHTLRKVEYRPKVHEKLIGALVDGALSYASQVLKKADYPTELWDEVCIHFGNALLWQVFYAVLGFKQEAFEAEQEWRLITVGSEPSEVEHRMGPYGLTPYVSHGPTSKDEKLPIVSVTHGPTASPRNTQHAINTLLERHGYDVGYIHVEPSDLPIRLRRSV